MKERGRVFHVKHPPPLKNIMKIAIGADHRGFSLKEVLKEFLKEKGYEVIDFGTHSEESFDYPDAAIPVGEAVASGEADRGILICMTGIGMSIAANKVKGVRAALVTGLEFAELSRRHNDANVICLQGGYVDPEDAKKFVEVFLTTEFEGGRHERRVNKIKEYESTH